MPKESNPDYQRGYAAGRARGSADRQQARRDRFAAAALTGLLAAPRAWGIPERGNRPFQPDSTPDEYAKTAFAIADAMMGKAG